MNKHKITRKSNNGKQEKQMTNVMLSRSRRFYLMLIYCTPLLPDILVAVGDKTDRIWR